MSLLGKVNIRDTVRFTENDAIPIYRQIAESLRQSILSGEFKEGCKLPSESEFAKELGINHLTLRKSLQILSEQKLITQRQGKGTFVNSIHRPQRRLGIIIQSQNYFNDVYFLQLLVTITDELQRSGGGETVLLNCCNFAPENMIDEVNKNRCDSLLVLSCDNSYLSQLYSRQFDHLPIVFINHHGRDLKEAGRYNVAVKENIITRGMDYLFQLGHRRILYISIENPNNPALQRRNMEFLNYPLKEKIPAILPFRGRWHEAGREVALKYCSSPKPPTAILSSGITFAFGAWSGALEAGMKIPEDVSFIGIDGNPHFNPLMTTLDQPMRPMIAKALELLSDMCSAGKHLKKRVYLFEPELIERGSCRKIER